VAPGNRFASRRNVGTTRASGVDITRLIAMTLAVDGIQNADTGPNIY